MPEDLSADLAADLTALAAEFVAAVADPTAEHTAAAQKLLAPNAVSSHNHDRAEHPSADVSER